MKLEDKKLLKEIAIITVIFMLIAHGYCYLNIIFSHDSINIYHSGFYGDSIGIGRFLIPVWNYIRGAYYPPLLIGILSILFFVVINYLIVKMFNFEDKGLRIALCGILTTCTSITLLNATYINYSDMYIFAILLNVIAVYLLTKKDKISILAIMLLFVSLGLYQTYIGVTIGLCMVYLINELLNKKDPKTIIKKGIIYCINIIISLILYSIATKIVSRITHIELETYYNSVSNFGNFGSIKNMLLIILNTYKSFFNSLIISNTFHKTIVTFTSNLLFLLFIYFLVKTIFQKKLTLIQIIILLLLITLLPFGFNIIYFMSNGKVHGLMLYPIFSSFIFILSILENNKKIRIKYLIYCFLIIIIGSNIFFSNQVYEKKHMEFESTKLVINRIINRIEETPGYEPGKTPIVFIGNINQGPLKVKKSKFEYGQVGLSQPYSTTYPQTYYRFIYYYLGYPINIYENEKAIELSKKFKAKGEVKKMGIFPAKDSVKMVSGSIVVKLA